jgi:recombination protein RecR
VSYPEPIRRLIEELGRLPGIGEKSAERLALWIVNHPREDAARLAAAVREVKEAIRVCSVCCNLSLEEPCEICKGPKRERERVCVVEEIRDLWAIEKAECYKGLYHVLHGRIAPLDGVGPNDLTLGRLVQRVKAGGIEEVILATNPTIEGDATAHAIGEALAPSGVRVTRLARGLPSGMTMEYASRMTISDAMKGRREFSDGGR